MGSKVMLFAIFSFVLFATSFSATVIINSLDYEDIVASAVYARHNGDNFVFALTPNQSTFIVKYLASTNAGPIIYIEGKRTVLPNMEAMVRDSGLQNITPHKVDSVPLWVADQLPKSEAIIVGSQYGQDALSVSSLAALKGSPIFFVGDKMPSDIVAAEINKRGYRSVLVYGSVARQIPAATLASLPSKRTIDTGSKYTNNLAVVSEFLKIRNATQVMFVSGRSFEKSMVDRNFPLVLAGRSDALPEMSRFILDNNITAGIVFVGDADIVDGVTKIRAANPRLSLFAKFGEGYIGNSQPLPLTVFPLPSPNINLELSNLSYNIPSKAFEARVSNKGDYAALTAGISIDKVGSSDSSLIYLDSGSTTTLAIPLDASAAIVGKAIPSALVTVRYGEDTRLLDNIDTITYNDVPLSEYSDNSSVSISSVTYNPSTKAFEFVLNGNGFVEGTVRFSINDVPIVLRIPNTQVAGQTTVSVKYLLSQDEQGFVNGLASDYFLRYGSKGDVLLRESKGSMPVSVTGIKLKMENASQSGGEGVPWLMVIGAIVAIAVVAFIFMKMRGGRSEEFE